MTSSQFATMSREELIGVATSLSHQLQASAGPRSFATKRSIAQAKDPDLFSDLRGAKISVGGTRKHLRSYYGSKFVYGKETEYPPLIRALVDQVKAFEKSVVALDERLIAEYQDA